ncbi:MAG: TonB-dependent receptor [Chloroherpetonaceae bacterium]
MKRAVVFTVLILLGVRGAIADDEKVGRLKGIVRDSEKNEAIIGATVMLSNTRIGTRADETGRFELSSVPTGVYEVKISAVGYKPRFRQVEIRAGQTTTLDIHLVATGVSGEEVVISATRYEQNLVELPVTTSVVSASQIAAQVVPSIDRVLETVPGIDVTRSGGAGASNLQIRGSQGFTGGGLSTRVMMLYDGFPMNSADAGSVDWQTVTATNLSRLEVVKGASSSLYGSAAMGGVINAISLVPNELTIKARIMNGMYDNPPPDVNPFPGIKRPMFSSSMLMVGDQLGNVSYNLTYLRNRDEGYREAGDLRTDDIKLTLRYNLSETQYLQLTGIANWSEGGIAYQWTNRINALGTPPGPVFKGNGEPLLDANGNQILGQFFLGDDQKQTTNQLFGVTYMNMLNASASWETKLYFSRTTFLIKYYPTERPEFQQFDAQGNFLGNYQKYSFGRVNRRPYDPNDPTTFNDSDARRYGGRTSLYWMRDKHKLTTGVEFNLNDVRSTIYTTTSDFNLGAFAQDEIALTEKFKVTAGIRLDWNKVNQDQVTYIDQLINIQEGRTEIRTDNIITKSLWQISPKLAVNYMFNEEFAVRASVGRSFRAPSIGERFVTQAGFFLGNPNPALDAERLTSYEIGLYKSFSRYFTIDIAGYVNHYSNLIESTNINPNASVLDISSSVFQFFNVASADIRGIEASITSQPFEQLQLQVNYNWMRAMGSFPDNVLGGNKNPEKYKNWLPYRPEHNFSFRAELAFKDLGIGKVRAPEMLSGLSLNYSGRYVSRINAVRIAANSEGIDYPGNFFVMNAGFRWQFFNNRFAAVGTVMNLANTQYEELELYRAPGRSFNIGFEFNY